MSVGLQKRVLVVVCIVVLLCVLITIILSVTLSSDKEGEGPRRDYRLDCAPEAPKIRRNECVVRGCRFDEFAVPSCYFPSLSEAGDSRTGYDVVGELPDTKRSFQVALHSRGARHSDIPVERVNAKYSFLTEQVLRIKVSLLQREMDLLIMIQRRSR